MGKRFNERFEPDLFTKEKPERGERGYLEPGFHFNSEGEIEDEKGNVYDEHYGLIREAPSEGLKMAKERHPDWTDEELAPLARIFNAQIEVKKKKEKKEGSG